MRILQIHTKLVAGGIEAIVSGLTNALSLDHDVTVCTIFEPNQNDVFYKRLLPNINRVSIGKKDFGFSIKEVFRIFQLIRRGNFDVVHIHGCFQYYALSVLFCHRMTRFFYTIHSDAKMENQKWDWRLFFFKRFCFKYKWIHPVTISPESQKSFKELYHCCCDMVLNGIEKPVVNAGQEKLKEYRFTQNTLLFLHPGRISKPKNQIVLCEVFDEIIKEGYDVVLLIAGANEEKDIFENMKKYFQSRIVYLGERGDIPQLLAETDAFCLPSIWEGLPVTLLEALSVGCIPICSPVGGIVNVIDGNNGILSRSSQKDDYKAAVISFINMSPLQREQMKKQAEVSFEKYDIFSMKKKYVELYEKY